MKQHTNTSSTVKAWQEAQKQINGLGKPYISSICFTSNTIAWPKTPRPHRWSRHPHAPLQHRGSCRCNACDGRGSLSAICHPASMLLKPLGNLGHPNVTPVCLGFFRFFGFFKHKLSLPVYWISYAVHAGYLFSMFRPMACLPSPCLSKQTATSLKPCLKSSAETATPTTNCWVFGGNKENPLKPIETLCRRLFGNKKWILVFDVFGISGSSFCLEMADGSILYTVEPFIMLQHHNFFCHSVKLFTRHSCSFHQWLSQPVAPWSSSSKLRSCLELRFQHVSETLSKNIATGYCTRPPGIFVSSFSKSLGKAKTKMKPPPAPQTGGF